MGWRIRLVATVTGAKIIGNLAVIGTQVPMRAMTMRRHITAAAGGTFADALVNGPKMGVPDILPAQ